jgi:Na+/proline symporter
MGKLHSREHVDGFPDDLPGASDEGLPRLGVFAAVAVIFASILNTLGVFTEDAIHSTNWLIGFASIALAAAIVFGWFVRRSARNAHKAWRAGLVLGVLSVLSVAAFWSGLPPIFGVAAIYLGAVAYRGQTNGTARWAGISAMSLGSLALILDVLAYGSDIASRI